MNSELLYVFGTGNATVTNLYNTCFALRDGDEYFMVDAGGGNGILKILDNMQVSIEHIHHIFVTHAHTDHVLGIVWMVRMIATAMKKGKYDAAHNTKNGVVELPLFSASSTLKGAEKERVCLCDLDCV